MSVPVLSAEDTEQLRKERRQLYVDFYNHKIPKRLPVSASFSRHVLAEYAGVDPISVLYDPSLTNDAARELAGMVYSDTLPVGGASITSRPTGFHQLLDSQSFQMSADGFMQHPNVVGMYEDEYDLLIKDPYAFILEKVLPRQFKQLNLDEPITRINRFLMAKAAINHENALMMPLITELNQKYGYSSGAAPGASAFGAAPYDFIADQLRSFSGISLDVRRKREKVIEACNALMPMLFYWSRPEKVDPLGSVGAPLHMPSYMREKDFVEVWLPTFLTMSQQYAALGIKMAPFCEHDWMRYMDILQEMPAASSLRFEYGDPAVIKEKLGKKYIISGLYPVGLLKSGTKQQVIDKAKELLDIMMPGGGYMFGFDKSAITLSDINLPNYIALNDFLHEYAVYPNAGEEFGMKTNTEGYVFDQSVIGNFESKYRFDWDEYKKQYPLAPDFAKADFEKMDKEVFTFYINMLV